MPINVVPGGRRRVQADGDDGDGQGHGRVMNGLWRAATLLPKVKGDSGMLPKAVATSPNHS